MIPSLMAIWAASLASSHGVSLPLSLASHVDHTHTFTCVNYMSKSTHTASSIIHSFTSHHHPTHTHTHTHSTTRGPSPSPSLDHQLIIPYLWCAHTNTFHLLIHPSILSNTHTPPQLWVHLKHTNHLPNPIVINSKLSLSNNHLLSASCTLVAHNLPSLPFLVSSSLQPHNEDIDPLHSYNTDTFISLSFHLCCFPSPAPCVHMSPKPPLIMRVNHTHLHAHTHTLHTSSLEHFSNYVGKLFCCCVVQLRIP